jgi:hypothetical protein
MPTKIGWRVLLAGSLDVTVTLRPTLASGPTAGGGADQPPLPAGLHTFGHASGHAISRQSDAISPTTAHA